MVTDDIPTDDSDSFGSLTDEDLENNNDDDDNALESNWIEELECALLAECDLATLKKICEGKKIPASIRPDYWIALLALKDAEKIKLTSEYDLPNQDEIRRDCELLIDSLSADITSDPLADSDKLRLRNNFESTITTYLKARPELEYVGGNGWTDILKVLHDLKLSDVQMYQMFFRIVDRYVPRDLSPIKQRDTALQTQNGGSDLSTKDEVEDSQSNKQRISKDEQQTVNVQTGGKGDLERSVQAYHLLRLLIQYHDPELCSILDSRRVTPNMYVKDWFCSLFARSCSPQLALHIWDTHFKMADPFLIFFAAIVMVVNASDELKKSNMSQQNMLNVLKAMPGKLEEDDIEDLYYLVSNHYTYSTPRSIRSYSHLFFMDTFGNTYSGNDSPSREGSPTFVDAKTAQLTGSIDLSQYLCLPIVPAEIFALETAKKQQQTNPSPDLSPTSTLSQSLRYFLVDCRPAEQYNAGHLNKAFHLDCSLMLREPSSFATAVQALLEIQRQVVASKSNTGGQHLCFIGSGREEEDQYVNMVVASFLQKYHKYVSIVYGGYDAIHDYVQTKSELCDSFDKFIVDHKEELCKACCSSSPEALERLNLRATKSTGKQATQQYSGLSSSIFATTTNFFKSEKASAQATLSKFASSNPQASATANMLAQSGASMIDKFATAFVSKSSVLKNRLVETINNAAIPNSAYAAARSHVSSHDRLGPRYLGSGSAVSDDNGGSTMNVGIARLNDTAAHLLAVGADQLHGFFANEGPCQEVQLDVWEKENDIVAIRKCVHAKKLMYPGYVAFNRTHLWILHEIPHNKGFASIAAQRPLDKIVRIASRRNRPDYIAIGHGFKNATPSSSSPASSSDNHADMTVNNKDQNLESKAEPEWKRRLTVIATDNLQIPNPEQFIPLIKREIYRVIAEASAATITSTPQDTTQKQADGCVTDKSEVKDDTTGEKTTDKESVVQDTNAGSDGV